MRFTSILLSSTLLAGTTGLYAGQPSAALIGSSSTFSVTEKTQIPGSTLKPGDYSIHVMDQLSDRMIVSVDGSANKDHSVFLAVPHAGLGTQSSSGPVNWKVGPNGTPAIRGFQFSSGSVIEFVYPKAQAAAIAQINSERVVAVDPDSEGRPAVQKMSSDDKQEVTLWMLSLTTAGPGNKTPAILAKRYQPEPGSSGPSTVTASRSAPQSNEVASLDTPTRPTTASSAPSPVKHQKAIAKLPHTASSLPLIWLMGMFSMLSAAILRLLRRNAAAKA